MGLDLSHGGHLTHGSKVSFSGQIYNSVTFQVKKDTGLVDFDDLLKKPENINQNYYLRCKCLSKNS